MQSSRQAHRRPYAVTLLAYTLFAVAVLGWLRFYAALRDWALLVELHLQPGPAYFATGGFVWGVAGLVAAISLLRAIKWAPWIARIVSLLVVLTYWLDRWLGAQVSQPQSNTPFALVASLSWLALVWLTLALPASQRFFQIHTREVFDGSRSGN